MLHPQTLHKSAEARPQVDGDATVLCRCRVSFSFDLVLGLLVRTCHQVLQASVGTDEKVVSHNPIGLCVVNRNQVFVDAGKSSFDLLAIGIFLRPSDVDHPHQLVLARAATGPRSLWMLKSWTSCSSLGAYVGMIVMIHAENSDIIDTITKGLTKRGHTLPEFHAVARPQIAESEAT